MEKTIEYKTTGTCSKLIKVVADDDVVKSVEFVGGCHGNTQGVAKLCIGRKTSELIGLLEGIDCHERGTSCPDQLAKALKTL